MVEPAATSPTQWSTSQHSTMCIAFAINLSSATSERQKQIDNTHKDEARDTTNDPNNIVDSINHRNTTIGQSDDKLSMKILCGTFANSLCLFCFCSLCFGVKLSRSKCAHYFLCIVHGFIEKSMMKKL